MGGFTHEFRFMKIGRIRDEKSKNKLVLTIYFYYMNIVLFFQLNIINQWLIYASYYSDRYSSSPMYHIISIDYREHSSRPIYVSYKPDRISRISIKTDMCII